MFKNPFSFEGRIRRSEYVLSMLIYALVSGIVNAIVEASDGDAAFIIVVYIPLIWFIVAQAAKRCHDLGNNGWWQLIPFYGLWLIFEDSHTGPNKYGENPKNIQSSGQTFQSGQSSNSAGSGYQGGYSGGHNNLNTNYSATKNLAKTEGYKDGQLYK